jgi:hypothetical protein
MSTVPNDESVFANETETSDFMLPSTVLYGDSSASRFVHIVGGADEAATVEAREEEMLLT